MSQYEDMGDFKGWNFAENHYVCHLNKNDPIDRYLALYPTYGTNAVLQVPFAHRLVKILFTQCTAALNVNAYDPILFKLYRGRNDIAISPNSENYYIYQDALIDASNVLTFGDGYEFEPSKWNLVFQGTATNVVYPLVYLQRLGRGK